MSTGSVKPVFQLAVLSIIFSVASPQAQTAVRKYICTDEIKELQCPVGHIITINRVYFGLKSERECVTGRRTYSENCCRRTAADDCIVIDMNIQERVNTLCSGKNKCRVSARGILARNMCRRYPMFTETDRTDFKVIIYHCIPASDIVSLCSDDEMTGPSLYISTPSYPTPIRGGYANCSCVVVSSMGVMAHALDVYFPDTNGVCEKELTFSEPNNRRNAFGCNRQWSSQRLMYRSSSENLTITLTNKDSDNGYAWLWLKPVDTEEQMRLYCGEAMRRYLYGEMVTTTSKSASEMTSTTPVVTQSPTTIQTTKQPSQRETTPERTIQTTPEPSIRATTEPLMKTTPEPSIQTTSEPSIQTTSKPSIQTTPEPSIQDTTIKVEMVTTTSRQSTTSSGKQVATGTKQKTMVLSTSSPGMKTETTTEAFVPTKTCTMTKETKSTSIPEPETKTPLPEPEAEYTTMSHPEPETEPKSTTVESKTGDNPVTEPGVDKPDPMGCSCLQVMNPVFNLGMLHFPDEDTIQDVCSTATAGCSDDAESACNPYKHILMAAKSYVQIFCQDHREDILKQQACFDKVRDDTKMACGRLLSPPMSDDGKFEPETEEEQCKRLMEHQDCITKMVKEQCSQEAYDLASVVGEKLIRSSFENQKLVCSVNKQPVQGGNDGSAANTLSPVMTLILWTSFIYLTLR